MKCLCSSLWLFMDPRTGELASHRQIPPAEYGDILVADQSGYFSPSLALIDAKIDINSLKKLTNGLNEASVILQKHSDAQFFPNSQVLDDLANGFLLKEDGGVLSTRSTIPPERLELPYGQLFIGNSDNVASPSQTISLDNLPNLGVAVVSGLSLPAGKIWRGTSSNRPEESNAVSIMEADILAINARFLLGNFIMGDALIQYTFPNSQFLINLTDGMLKKTGKTLETAIAGEDYLQELPNLTADMVWRGDPTNRPVEAPYVSEERLQELVEQAEAAAEEAEAAAEEATGAAEEATAAATEATAAAGEATAAAGEASFSAGAAAASATAAAASAAVAAYEASNASDYASDAEGYKNEAHTYANNASTYATQSQTYYNNLINTGLNALPCSGDVSLNGFKIINVAPPVNDNDGVNKKYYDDGYAVLQSEIDNIEPGATSITLQGDITGAGPLNAPVSTTFNKTLNQISNAGNININTFKLVNVVDPTNPQDVATKKYVDLITTPSAGSFTPIICNGSGQDIIGNPTYGGQGYSLQRGRYVKFGPLVFCEIYIICSGNGYGADTTSLYFTGFPFPPRNQPWIPLVYSFCDNNNLLEVFINTIAVGPGIYPINCVYQSLDESLNPTTLLKRGAINKLGSGYNTSFNASFFYTTNS